MTRPWRTARSLSVVAALLLFSGAMHHWVHGARAADASRYTPPAKPLTDLPRAFGPFRSAGDLSLRPEVVEVAEVDEYVYREYGAGGGSGPIEFYVGYWGRQNRGLGHGPEVCYPAVGWDALEAAQQRVNFVHRAGGQPATANVAIHHFERTDATGIARVAVGFAAGKDGGFAPGSRGTFEHRPDRGVYLAHVQVAVPVEGGRWKVADERIVAFMEQALPHVAECIFGESVRGD